MSIGSLSASTSAEISARTHLRNVEARLEVAVGHTALLRPLLMDHYRVVVDQATSSAVSAAASAR
jgi:hypothetical protein